MKIVGQEEERTLSVHKEHEFLLKLEVAGLNNDLAQMVIGSKDNELAIKVVSFIQNGGVVGVDPRFSFLKSFRLTVPANYVHANRLDSFAKTYKTKFYSYNNNITDENFAKVSHQLVPGKTYVVRLFGIKKGEVVSSNDCLGVYRANKAYFTGAQGASVVWEYKREELIKGKWHCSFDEKVNFLFVDGDHRVPDVHAASVGAFYFGLGYFGSGWGGASVLVLLCDCEE